MRHYDKRVMMIHADYQKAISEKDAELSAQRSRSESLEADLIDSVVKIEALQKELSGNLTIFFQIAYHMNYLLS